MLVKDKSKKRSNQKRTIIIVLFLVLFLIPSLYMLSKYYYQNPNNVTKDTVKTEDQTVKEGSQDTKPNDTPNSQNSTTDISAVITSITINDRQLNIKSVINGVISNSGLCELTLVKVSDNTNTVSASAESYAMTSYSTCKGFKIDASNMPSGAWVANLKVVFGNKTTTATKEFNL